MREINKNLKKAILFFMFLISLEMNCAQIFTIAINHAPPYRIIDNSEYRGIYIDIIKEVAKAANIKIQFVEVPFKRALENMKSGKVDIMLGPNKTEEREAYMYFINEYPFPREAKAFYYFDDSNIINKYDDLYGKRIDVLKGAKYFERFDKDEKLGKNEVSDYVQAINKIKAGRSDVVIMPELEGDYFLKETNSLFFKSPYLVEGNLSYVAVSRKSKNFLILKEKLTLGLKKVNESGKYKKILDSYKN